MHAVGRRDGTGRTYGLRAAPHKLTIPLVRLYHFSDSPDIKVFVPRTPAHRPELEPFVWAVDEDHAAAYLFPRECPRVLLWSTALTTPADRSRWWDEGSKARMIAHVEWSWYRRLRDGTIYRYELPCETFAALADDDWMWVSRDVVVPCAVERITDIFGAIEEAQTELRFVPSLALLWGAWETTVHFSGIRLTNSATWPLTAPSPIPRPPTASAER